MATTTYISYGAALDLLSQRDPLTAVSWEAMEVAMLRWYKEVITSNIYLRDVVAEIAEADPSSGLIVPNGAPGRWGITATELVLRGLIRYDLDAALATTTGRTPNRFCTEQYPPPWMVSDVSATATITPGVSNLRGSCPATYN